MPGQSAQAAGGIISAAILSTPGASRVYRGGLTLYTLESRTAYAGWTQEMTDDYRGPTTDVVSFLARNVRTTLASTYTICESGTAGPTGGSTRNRTPYGHDSLMSDAANSFRGYVALAVASEDNVHVTELETGHADREGNMVEFAHGALQLLLSVIRNADQKL